MAIVFISPQKRKKILLQSVTALFGVILVTFSFVMFFRTPKPTIEVTFEPEEIKINFGILEKEQINNLKLFEIKVKKEFNYQARNVEGEEEEGKIVAVSVEKAEDTLEELGFMRIEIEEPEKGRGNPFISQAIKEEIIEEE